jgi:hypothetical protein
MGRPPIGKSAMTDAERQARRREKQATTSTAWLAEAERVQDALFKMKAIAAITALAPTTCSACMTNSAMSRRSYTIASGPTKRDRYLSRNNVT